MVARLPLSRLTGPVESGRFPRTLTVSMEYNPLPLLQKSHTFSGKFN